MEAASTEVAGNILGSGGCLHESLYGCFYRLSGSFRSFCGSFHPLPKWRTLPRNWWIFRRSGANIHLSFPELRLYEPMMQTAWIPAHSQMIEICFLLYFLQKTSKSTSKLFNGSSIFLSEFDIPRYAALNSKSSMDLLCLLQIPKA